MNRFFLRPEEFKLEFPNFVNPVSKTNLKWKSIYKSEEFELGGTQASK